LSAVTVTIIERWSIPTSL